MKSILSTTLLFGLAAAQTPATTTAVAEAEPAGATTEAMAPEVMTAAAAAPTAVTAPAQGTPVVLTNVVEFYDRKYATIDNAFHAAPIDKSHTCSHMNWLAVPEGWQVATPSVMTLLSVEANDFGTPTLMLEDAAYNHDLSKAAPMNLLETKDINGVTLVRSTLCPARILLQSADLIANPKLPYQQAAAITEFITFKGRDYAAIDNHKKSDLVWLTAKPLVEVPGGWEVAADTDESKAATVISARYFFGAKCKIFASGNGYEETMSTNDATCGPNMLKFVNSKAVNKVLAGPALNRVGRVIISRPSTLPDTWNSTVPITNVYVTKNGTKYATIDNTPASMIISKQPCQNVAMEMPEGWTLATPSHPGWKEAASQQFGTYCKGLSHNGTECPYVVLNAGRYYGVKYCNGKVLAYKEPAACKWQWSDWSACSADCSRSRQASVTEPADNNEPCNLPSNQNEPCMGDGCTAAQRGSAVRNAQSGTISVIVAIATMIAAVSL